MSKTKVPVIQAEGLEFSYDGQSKPVLEDFSLRLESGQRLALLGRSGSGKSTVVRLLLGLDAPRQGVIRIRGREVSRGGRMLVPPWKRNLAVVFQGLALWPHMTVWGNLEFGLKARKIARKERAERIQVMLERVGLAHAAHRNPGQLSGGERQRVAIARALVLQPEAVLLDEPLSNLDVVLRARLLDLFSELFSEAGSSVLYVTHDPSEARRIASRLCVLDGGRLVFQGSELPQDSDNPFVRELARIGQQKSR